MEARRAAFTLAVTLAVLLLTAAPLAAQVRVRDRTGEYDYGKPSDLREVKTAFVDTFGDTEKRDRIISEIARAKISVKLLDSSEGADCVLAFVGTKKRSLVNARNTRTRKASVWEAEIATGKGYVFKPQTSGRALLLYSFDDEQRLFQRAPEVNFARQFVKEFKKANKAKSN